MGRNQRDEPFQQWAIINHTNDPSIDCNSNSALTNGDGIGTIVQDLIKQGIFSGTVA
jgi:hypothetical protein